MQAVPCRLALATVLDLPVVKGQTPAGTRPAPAPMAERRSVRGVRLHIRQSHLPVRNHHSTCRGLARGARTAILLGCTERSSDTCFPAGLAFPFPLFPSLFSSHPSPVGPSLSPRYPGFRTRLHLAGCCLCRKAGSRRGLRVRCASGGARAGNQLLRGDSVGPGMGNHGLASGSQSLYGRRQTTVPLRLGLGFPQD